MTQYVKVTRQGEICCFQEGIELPEDRLNVFEEDECMWLTRDDIADGNTNWYDHSTNEWRTRELATLPYSRWVDGAWVQEANALSIMKGEVQHKIKEKRLQKLFESDWTQFADSPLTNEKKAEWATYRQELRDLPSQHAETTEFNSVTFPTSPDGSDVMFKPLLVSRVDP